MHPRKGKRTDIREAAYSNIKLMECDLNFGLKCAFAWRLGKFTEKHDLYKNLNMLFQDNGVTL